MALYPGAKVELIDRYKEGGSAGGAMPKVGRLIFHTAVSSSDDLHDYFNVSGRALAHFYVTGDGKVFQYVDTSRRASAVLDGNYDAITVETEDIGAPWFRRWTGSAVPKWTEAQVQALAELAVWAHKTHGIPLKGLFTSAPGHRGLGTHRLGCPGNFPAKGIFHGWRGGNEEKWTTSPGKVCPGDHRIAQTYNEVLPLAHEILDAEANPRIDVSTPEKRAAHIKAALQEIHLSIQKTKPESHLRKTLRSVARTLRQIIARSEA